MVYPYEAYEYKKLTIDNDSVKQIMIIINLMINYYTTLIPPEWEDASECKSLRAISSNKSLPYTELVHSAIFDSADGNHIPTEQCLIDILSKYMLDMDLSNDQILIDVIAPNVYRMLLAIGKHIGCKSHVPKKIISTQFHAELRSILNVETASCSAEFTALYESLSTLKQTKK